MTGLYGTYRLNITHEDGTMRLTLAKEGDRSFGTVAIRIPDSSEEQHRYFFEATAALMEKIWCKATGEEPVIELEIYDMPETTASAL